MISIIVIVFVVSGVLFVINSIRDSIDKNKILSDVKNNKYIKDRKK